MSRLHRYRRRLTSSGCDGGTISSGPLHGSTSHIAAERAVSAAARSARRRLDAVVRRLTLGHSCVADGLTDSCVSFGTSRIYDHDSPALPNQVEDATGHRFPSIWRDSLRVHRWKLVHDKASIVALVEPLLECRFVAGLL